MENFEKYIDEAAISMVKIEACVNEILKKHRNKRKPIPYDDVLEIASQRRLYKDDLPEIQCQIEDAGYIIDYD